MTTKTQAAKAFAETHGSYSPTRGEYVLAGTTVSLTEARATVPASRLDAMRNDRDDALERLGKARRRHRDDLRIVMALLGVEDQYQDTVETQEHYMGYGVSMPEQVVTEHAADKFATDLRAAQSAIDGAAALKRLRKAVKSVQKESDK